MLILRMLTLSVYTVAALIRVRSVCFSLGPNEHNFLIAGPILCDAWNSKARGGTSYTTTPSFSNG